MYIRHYESRHKLSHVVVGKRLRNEGQRSPASAHAIGQGFPAPSYFGADHQSNMSAAGIGLA